MMLPVSSVEDLHSTVELHPQKIALGQLTAHLLIAGIFAFPMAPKVRYDLTTFRLTANALPIVLLRNICKIFLRLTCVMSERW